MTLRLVRVDDRLIHGQVIAVWLRALNPEIIVIADDETAADDFLAEVLELAAPPGVTVEVYSVADAAPRVRELMEAPQGAFVLMRSPLAAIQLREAGVPIDVLNIGGIGASPDRRPFYRNISASDSEVAAMRQLQQMGTRVEMQIVADDTPVPFMSVAAAQTRES